MPQVEINAPFHTQVASDSSAVFGCPNKVSGG